MPIEKWAVDATPEDEAYAGRLSTKSAEYRRRVQRDLYMDNLDKPEHTLEYGGLNGSATIRGVPVGPEDKPQFNSKKAGLHSEPIAVVMRDAVTIETAIRLTGIARGTLAQAVFRGNIPALKTGPGPAPYLVRVRDLITYMITMWSERRARKESAIDNQYIGFPEWIAREVSESWPEDQPYKPGRWQADAIRVNRGGRPRGYSPGKGVSVHGKALGRPRKDPPIAPPGAETPAAEKAVPPEGNHPQAAPTGPVKQDDSSPPYDPTKLPKWDPRWRRSADAPTG